MNLKVKAHKTNKWAYPVEIRNKTKTVLKNGKVIDSASSMLRQAYKAGR
jgi:hypothetical protein